MHVCMPSRSSDSVLLLSLLQCSLQDGEWPWASIALYLYWRDVTCCLQFSTFIWGFIFLARGCNISDIMMQAKTCNYPVDIVLIPIKSLQTLSRVWSAGSKCSNVLYTHVAIGNHKETTTRLRLFFSSHNANPRHRDKTKHMSIRRKTQLRFRRLTIS